MYDESERADPQQANAAAYSNSYKVIDCWARSTGFRTNALRFSTLGHSNDPRIAEDFLINSRLRRNDRENEQSIANYFADGSVVMLSMLGQEINAGLHEIKLPEACRLHLELGEAIARRRSVRNFTGDAIELREVAALLRSAAGITCRAEVNLSGGGQSVLRFRSTASGGGLYPVDLYVAALNVNDLDRGLYRYGPVKEVLSKMGDSADVSSLLDCFCVPDDAISISRANLIFLLVGQPWRSMRKYGNRGMRFVFLEAGLIAQNIHLATVALGFGSVDCASIYDDEAHEAMNLDGLYQTLLHTIILGCPG